MASLKAPNLKVSNLKVALSIQISDKAEPYRAALERAGLEPIRFSPEAPHALAGCTGLVLAGGHDVDPALYGAEAQPETDPPDRIHDEFEVALIREALAVDMPILAICRGMQLLNVAMGGTLIQHLSGTSKHRQRTGGDAVHGVELNSALARIFGAPGIRVNSRHHQAVDQLGRNVSIAGRDPEDGVIEAITIPGARFVVGVQWHPENMVGDAVQVRLFTEFADIIKACPSIPAR